MTREAKKAALILLPIVVVWAALMAWCNRKCDDCNEPPTEAQSFELAKKLAANAYCYSPSMDAAPGDANGYVSCKGLGARVVRGGGGADAVWVDLETDAGPIHCSWLVIDTWRCTGVVGEQGGCPPPEDAERAYEASKEPAASAPSDAGAADAAR